MRILYRVSVIVAVCFAIAGGARPTAAQKPTAPVIIVVDLRKIEREATATKSIREQIGAKRQSHQERLAAMENELRQANQELQRQRAILSAEAFAQKRQELEQRAGKMQREVQKIQRGLQRARGKAMSLVRKKMLEVVAKLVTERGANMALDKSFVIFTRDGQNLDVTGEVLARLNKVLPKTTVEEKIE